MSVNFNKSIKSQIIRKDVNNTLAINETHKRQNTLGQSSRSKSSKLDVKDEISCKRCATCYIIRTPRVFHCKICDCCISVHDHHCPWLGACIGQRNHKWFYLFTWFTKIHAFFCFVLNSVLVSNLSFNISTEDSFGDSDLLKLNIPITIMVIYGALVFALLLSLTCYHSFLIANNSTTQEEMRQKHELWGGNPYNRASEKKKNLNYFLKQH